MTSTRASHDASYQPLDTFEQALLTELRDHVAERNSAPAPASRPRLKRLALVAASMVACGSVVVGAMVLRPDAAFAVEKQANNDIVVTISSLEDADGLEAALAKNGVQADVTYGDSSIALPPAEVLEGASTGPIVGSDSVTDVESGQGGVGQAGSAGAGSAEAGSGELPCGAIAVETNGAGVTFRLPAQAVDAEAPLVIQLAGGSEGWSSIAVQWNGPVC